MQPKYRADPRHTSTALPGAGLLRLALLLLLGLAIATPASHAWAEDDDDERMERRESREFDEDDFEERERDEDEDEGEDDEDFEEDYEEEFEMHLREKESFLVELEVFERLISIVQRSAEINLSPQMSAIAAVMAVDDHVEEIEEVVEFLEPMLRESDDAAVKRAIRFKLIDAYRELDEPRKSLGHMKALILMEDK
ncbi:MAG: hypothetical protein AAF750_08170 [Planctomycetota bacterium]